MTSIKNQINSIDRKKILLQEICFKGNLWDFQATLERIINGIEENNGRLSCCETCETSRIEHDKSGSRSPHIRIGFKTRKEKPIHIIWDILHEFGHLVSGAKGENEKTVYREIEAWQKAFNELLYYDDLKVEVLDFKLYARECLRTYGLCDEVEFVSER
jgi:hypothetical protein